MSNENLLDKFNSNIIKWYPFKNKRNILQIGENNEITNTLKETFDEIKVVDDINEIKLEEKYDYILIYGYESRINTISKISNNLNDDGKVIIIGDNQFGINNWSKFNQNRKEGVLLLEENEINTISDVKDEIFKNNLVINDVFCAFPDYKKTELILNSKFDISKEQFEKYNPNITEQEIKVFDERQVLKNVAKKFPEAIEMLANSYFIVASKSNEKNRKEIVYVSFNNCRKEEYQLITIITETDVKKIPANKKAYIHLENMSKIINHIKDEHIEILDYEADGEIHSKLIKNTPTLDHVLASKEDDLNEVTQILNNLYKLLCKNTLEYNQCKEKIYLKDTNEKLLNKLHFMKHGYWDMIAKNCFYINNRFIFFDQEWEKEYLPAEFLLYRSIINAYDLVRKINVDELLAKLNILEYKDYFEQIDKKIMNETIDKKIYDVMYEKGVKGVDNLINENKDYNLYINKINNEILPDIRKDNANKQAYIEVLEAKLEKYKKIFFWKR